MKPGIYYGMPAAEYHAVQALSASGLKLLQRSPAHYYGKFLHPLKPDEVQTEAMRNGTLVHCATFEPDELLKRYAVKPNGMNFATKDGKAWRDAQTLEVVSAEDMQAAIRQANSIRRLADVGPLLTDGNAEVSVFWIDPDTGVLCKCRPDWVAPAGDGVVLIDGKTCTDASVEGFGRAIWNYAYHLQAQWYARGYAIASGQTVHGFVFAAVESAWPHVAASYMLGDDVLEAARVVNDRLLKLYAECVEKNRWPGYAASVEQITLPAWANRQLQEIAE